MDWAAAECLTVLVVKLVNPVENEPHVLAIVDAGLTYSCPFMLTFSLLKICGEGVLLTRDSSSFRTPSCPSSLMRFDSGRETSFESCCDFRLDIDEAWL